jgi:hypothetical protein
MCDHVRMKIAGMRATGYVVVTALAIGACSSAATEANHKQIQLGHGQAGGTSWRLVAFSNGDGDLCMNVLGQHGAELGDGGCGFGPAPADRDPSDYGTADLADGTALIYGPTPSVVRVIARRNPNLVIPNGGTSTTSAAPSSSAPGPGPDCNPSETPSASGPVQPRLPQWTRPGKWFVLHVTGNASCYKVTFYNVAGRPIAQTNF